MDYQLDLEYESESHLSPSKSGKLFPKIKLVPKGMDPKVVLQRLSDSDIAMINNNEDEMHQSLICDNCEQFFDTARALRQHKKTCHSKNTEKSSPKVKDSKEAFDDVPEHEFIYSNPVNGKDMNRWIVTLVIPPYTYTRVRQNLERGTADFSCNGCRNVTKKHSYCATAKLVEVDDEGKQIYRLISAKQEHECQPSPVNHLHTKFLHSMQRAIVKYSQKKLSEIYQIVKDHFCESLEDWMKKMFLAEVKPSQLFNNTYSLMRANLGLSNGKNSLEDSDINTNKLKSVEVSNNVLKQESQKDEMKEESELMGDVQDNSPLQNVQENSDEVDVPEHQFIYKTPNRGDNLTTWIATLVIPPYTFARNKQMEENRTATFSCNGCKNDKNHATAELVEIVDDGRSLYRLISYNRKHDCQPSPVNHLHAIFLHNLQNAFIKDPQKKLSITYQIVKDHLCLSLDNKMQRMFLAEVRPCLSFRKCLSYIKSDLRSGKREPSLYVGAITPIKNSTELELLIQNLPDEVKEESEEVLDTDTKEHPSPRTFHKSNFLEEFEAGDNVPKHQFIYSTPNSGKWITKLIVTLIIPPYTYTVKEKKNECITFVCNGCKNMQLTYAKAKLVEVGDEENPRYNLVSADQNHICQPSSVNHLHNIFMHHLRLAIVNDPLKKMRDTYNNVRDEFCSSLEEEMKQQFLTEIRPYDFMRSLLTKLRDNFGLSPDQADLYSRKPRFWQCDMCDFVTKSYKAYKNHKRSEHRGIKPYQCTTCGKFFSSKSILKSHEASGHVQMKGE